MAVQLRNSERDLVTNILIKDTHESDRHRREDQVDEEDIGVVEQVGDVKVVVYLIPKQCESPYQVLEQGQQTVSRKL